MLRHAVPGLPKRTYNRNKTEKPRQKTKISNDSHRPLSLKVIAGSFIF